MRHIGEMCVGGGFIYKLALRQKQEVVSTALYKLYLL